MGFFSDILSKLGIGEDKEEKSEPTTTTTKKAAPSRSARTSSSKPSTQRLTGKDIPRTTKFEVPMVDVVSKLDGLAAALPFKLSWKESIVDLLKLLEIDSSYEARVELAKELECPTELMGESAKMNTWLHKTVLQKIAKNGGNIPKALLD